MEIKDVGIKDICVTVPRKTIRCADFAPLFGEKEVARIVANSGIASLRVCEEGQTASDLCFEAAKCLTGKKERQNITAVVFVSQTPDFFLPSTGPILQERLGLPRDIITYDINSGCAGYVQGLFLSAMLASSSGGDVLLCVGDAISRYVSAKDRSLRLLIGDAGSATIVGSQPKGAMHFRFFTDGSRYSSLIVPAGGARTPFTEENTSLSEREGGNWRSDQHLFMDGMEIMKFVLSDVKDFIAETLKKEEDIESFIFHQANRFIVESLAKKLHLPPEKVPVVVDGYGNTSPVSIPLALCETYGGECPKSPGRTLMAGFGVGLAAGTVVTDLSHVDFHSIIECGRGENV